MKDINITPIEGKSQFYPQWEMIDEKLMEKVKVYHTELIDQGYEIMAANIAKKDNTLFWILLKEEDNTLYLDSYATM